MKISGLEFAFNDLEQKVHIDVAQKNTRWWLLEGKRVELVLCDGEKVKKYWRTKTDDEFEKITLFAPTDLAKFKTFVVDKILFFVVSTGFSTLYPTLGI